MTLLYVDGFEEQDALRDWALTVGSDMIYGTGRLAGQCVRLSEGSSGSGGTAQVGKLIPATSALYLGFAFRSGNPAWPSNTTGYTGHMLELWGDGGTTMQATIAPNPAGVMCYYRGNYSASPTAAGVTALLPNTWYYVEVYLTVADSGGRCTVKVNGVTEIDFTGDTKNAGTAASITQIRLAGHAGGNSGYYDDFDDLYVCDANGTVNNGFLGDVAVATLTPNGNGAANAWVGSDANSTDNYLLVDEAPVSTVDYVGSATVGAVDEYAFTDLPAGATVKGLLLRAVAQKSDAGTRSMSLVARPGSTDRASTAAPLGTAWAAVTQLLESNPDTATAWTAAEVNAAQFGVKVA